VSRLVALTARELRDEYDRLIRARRSCVRLGHAAEAFECTMALAPVRSELLRRNQIAAYFLPATQGQRMNGPSGGPADSTTASLGRPVPPSTALGDAA